jgi:hypothetical protein
MGIGVLSAQAIAEDAAGRYEMIKERLTAEIRTSLPNG